MRGGKIERKNVLVSSYSVLLKNMADKDMYNPAQNKGDKALFQLEMPFFKRP